MQIAYHISVHHKPDQFRRLFEAVYNPDDLFAIHIDCKAPESVSRPVFEIASHRPNVHFMTRHSVIYGEWALCRVELDGIAFFLKNFSSWHYFINLSGQDFPLKTRDAMVAELSKDPDRIYIDVIEFSSLPAYFRRRTRWACLRVGDRLLRTPIPLVAPKNIAIEWHGSAWHILSYDFCKWLLNADITNDCVKFFKRVKLPNEMLMQTIAMNGPFKDMVDRNYRRKLRWGRHKPHPETMTIADLDDLSASDAFFARKFDAEVDEEILHRLSEHLRRQGPAGAAPPS
jgi:hypothetical protein